MPVAAQSSCSVWHMGTDRLPEWVALLFHPSFPRQLGMLWLDWHGAHPKGPVLCLAQCLRDVWISSLGMREKQLWGHCQPHAVSASRSSSAYLGCVMLTAQIPLEIIWTWGLDWKVHLKKRPWPWYTCMSAWAKEYSIQQLEPRFEPGQLDSTSIQGLIVYNMLKWWQSDGFDKCRVFVQHLMLLGPEA